jgi:hypothetical protein
MHLQTYMIDTTRAAAAEAFRYAKAMPEDKVDWKPLDAGRSVLDLCRELALCPTWCYDTIEGKAGDWTEEVVEASRREQEQWKSVEACEAECNRRLEILFDLFSNMPDERLAETRWLPYDGGRDFTMPEMMDYPRWNFNYHLGQIAYIQTLYGDKENH